MPVQQHVLNWLYSVLTSEYHDVNRTYNDVARVLNGFPTLTPRTDVHTFSNGTNALLLHVSGTIPVVFRGSTYRFPLSIWVPHTYPREPPLVYVTPTQTMVVRPGQHVDPQGQVYHPYLVRWSEFWDNPPSSPGSAPRASLGRLQRPRDPPKMAVQQALGFRLAWQPLDLHLRNPRYRRDMIPHRPYHQRLKPSDPRVNTILILTLKLILNRIYPLSST
ncbi:UEV domain-containing protein [Hirsutella rhossiliensis]|uniref:UEV domain-containing protein n=1 Tax=Hirsutella rhossiliensis TaxID=111463 RepID=A0A9P8N5X6_9HYPO|nr:UEV domain-containing protein [Hirsutella rhossiliensis]KAH0967435.1 UEV domain-containing protein [Hirsutella rhossiliensis]